MKKFLLSICFSTALVTSCSVLAMTAKEALSTRLAMRDGFSASFQQKVVSPDGTLISQGTGKVDIARPSLFRWETRSPDENLLVSDGKTVWYYSPFVEQVTIYNQKQATEQTPFILLTRNQASDWEHYKVTQQGDTFTLVPLFTDSAQGEFHVQVDKQGVVHGFEVIEHDGQTSSFTFQHIQLKRPPQKTFTFTIPSGVEVDDQRPTPSLAGDGL